MAPFSHKTSLAHTGSTYLVCITIVWRAMAWIAACCSPVQTISTGSLTHPSTLQHLWPYDLWLTRLCLSWDALVDQKDPRFKSKQWIGWEGSTLEAITFFGAPCSSQTTSPVGHLNSMPAKLHCTILQNFKNAFHCTHVTPQKISKISHPNLPAWEESQLRAPAKASQKGDDFMIHNGNASLRCDRRGWIGTW